MELLKLSRVYGIVRRHKKGCLFFFLFSILSETII